MGGAPGICVAVQLLESAVEPQTHLGPRPGAVHVRAPPPGRGTTRTAEEARENGEGGFDTEAWVVFRRSESAREDPEDVTSSLPDVCHDSASLSSLDLA